MTTIVGRRSVQVLAVLAVLLVASAAMAAGGHGHEMNVGEELRKVLVHAVNFVIFVGLLVYFLRRPLKDFLANRRLAIAQQLDESRELKESAQTRHDEIAGRISVFGREVEEMLDRVRRECAVERERAIANAQEAGQALQRSAQRGVEKELDKARHDLRSETVELAMEVAEKVLRAAVSLDDHRRLASEYFQRIEKDAKP